MAFRTAARRAWERPLIRPALPDTFSPRRRLRWRRLARERTLGEMTRIPLPLRGIRMTAGEHEARPYGGKGCMDRCVEAGPAGHEEKMVR